jgi:drug/metabolite transporter (DMT)-like permease
MFALGLVAVCVLVGVVGQILMKSGMNEIGALNNFSQLTKPATLLRIFTNFRIIGGILCYALGLLLWLGALSNLNISFMYPLLSVGYIITAIFGQVFLNEPVTVLRWAGIIVVVIGCFMILRT